MGSPQHHLDAAAAVGSQLLPPPSVYELLGMGQQRLARGEEASAEPQQLPSPLLTVPAGSVGGEPSGDWARQGPTEAAM